MADLEYGIHEVHERLVEIRDLLRARLPEPGTCPRCEANAALHRRCPEHQPEEEAGLCIFCGQDTWDQSRMICTNPECELHEAPEPEDAIPNSGDVFSDLDADLDAQLSMEKGPGRDRQDALDDKAERTTTGTCVACGRVFGTDMCPECRLQGRAYQDDHNRPWGALRHPEQAIDKLDEGESKGGGGGPGAAEASGAPKPQGQTDAGAATSPQQTPIYVAWCPECGSRQVPHLDAEGCCNECGRDATGPGAAQALDLLLKEARHRKVWAAAEKVLQEFKWTVVGTRRAVLDGLQHALKEDEDA